MRISFTIPCYRSEHTVADVIREIGEKMAEQPELDYEIIAVNDCSPDDVLSVLRSLAAENERLKVIDLTRNGGKHAALMAAFSAVSGDVVVSVDDDGQCPLDRLWDLLEPLAHGYDMAMAAYPKKKQTFVKNFGSKVNDAMVRFLIGKPDGMVFSNFTARKRFLCDEIIKYRNPYPYMEGLTLRVTHNIAQVPMEERGRQYGTSGYTLKKSMSLWVNGCTAFSVKPLRVSTILGLVFAVLGFLYGAGLVVAKLIRPSMAAGYASTMAVMLLIGGLIMLFLGIIGEYIGRIYICINDSPQYVIRERINFEKSEDRPNSEIAPAGRR